MALTLDFPDQVRGTSEEAQWVKNQSDILAGILCLAVLPRGLGGVGSLHIADFHFNDGRVAWKACFAYVHEK